MKTNLSFWTRSMMSVLLAWPIASIHPAAAAVLWVTNDGADNASCGAQTTSATGCTLVKRAAGLH